MFKDVYDFDTIEEYKSYKKESKKMKTRLALGLGAVAIIVITGIILAFMSVKVISQGHAGVVYSRSDGIQEETLGQGWRLVHPMERVTEYPISTETVKVDSFSVQTKDGKPLTIDLSYDYMNELEKLPYIYNKFKGAKSESIQDGWLQTRIKKSALVTFSNYTVLDVFQNQGSINADIEEEFRKSVEEHGFIIDSVTLGAPEPDEETAKSIQEVVNAQQDLEKSEIKLKQAKIDAQTKIENAEGEAEANKIVNKSLNENLIQYNLIQKWNGELSKVSGSNSMIQLPESLIKDKE